MPLLQIAVISGRVWDWQAGFCFGPRYLAPMLPLLALPCALGVQRWPKLGITLGLYSIAAVTLATLTDACADYSVFSPLTELNIPKFLKGEFSYNLGTVVLGLPPFASVALGKPTPEQIGLALALAGSLALRLALFPFVSGDMRDDMIPWSELIEKQGAWNSLGQDFSNYPPL